MPAAHRPRRISGHRGSSGSEHPAVALFFLHAMELMVYQEWSAVLVLRGSELDAYGTVSMSLSMPEPFAKARQKVSEGDTKLTPLRCLICPICQMKFLLSSMSLEAPKYCPILSNSPLPVLFGIVRITPLKFSPTCPPSCP